MAGNKKMNNRKNVKKQGRPVSRNPMSGFTMTKTIFPPEFKGVMTFNSYVGVVLTASLPTTYSYRLNSVYDPDLTGTGTTAYGYTALSSLYNRYKVMGGRASVQFVNTSVASTTNYMVAAPVNSLGSDINKILAQRYVWSDSMSNTSSGPALLKHSISWRTAAVYGVPETSVRDDDDFAGLVGANPNNAIYLHVGGNPNGASTGSFNIIVRIEYDVVWSLPLLLVV